MRHFPERRKSPRHEWTTLPWLLELTTWPAGEQPLRLEAKNISLAGMKFISNQEFSLGKEIRFRLLHQDGKQFLELSGIVSRVEAVDTGKGERTYGIAVKFLAVDANQRTSLDRSFPSTQWGSSNFR